MTKKEFIELIKDAPDDSTMYYETNALEPKKLIIETVIITEMSFKKVSFERNSTTITLK